MADPEGDAGTGGTVKRRQLEHVTRAAADVSDDDEIIVIGSQSILGKYPDAPDASSGVRPLTQAGSVASSVFASFLS